jgi:hypothetical protein
MRGLREAEQRARAWAQRMNRQDRGQAPGEGSPRAAGPQTPIIFGAQAAREHELYEAEQRARAWAQRQNAVDAQRGPR